MAEWEAEPQATNYVQEEKNQLEMTSPPNYGDGAGTGTGQTNIVTTNNNTAQQPNPSNNNQKVVQPMDEFQVSTNDVSAMTQISYVVCSTCDE